MKFELAQLLEAAGCPQGGPGKWLDPNSIVGRRRVYEPTLEELFEACGSHLAALRQADTGSGWTASAANADASGATPAEVVARLWLRLEEDREKGVDGVV